MRDIEVRTHQGPTSGPHLVVLGAVHGNEPQGSAAIQKVSDELSSGILTLTSGTLTLVPVANRPAYDAGKRYLEEDLNRIFRKTAEPTSSEARLANELTGLIDRADVLLDIHTTSAPGPSCVFIDFPTPANRALASVVGAEYALLNWPELYEQDSRFDSYDTTRYAFESGKDGIIVETGQHGEPEAAIRAYQVILRILRHLGMAAEYPREELPAFVPITMTALYQKNLPGDMFTRDWRHLETVPAGSVVARLEDGTEIRVGRDMVMLLPKYHARPGEEWFYLGERVR